MENIVFAFWESDGFYYPAKISNQKGGFAEASFLDGQSARVKNDQFINVADAFRDMAFEADWKKGGGYYGCKINSVNSDNSKISVLYDDGAKENVDISQLRAYFSDDVEEDAENKEQTTEAEEDETPDMPPREAKMEAVRQRIKTTIIYLCLGWTVLMFFLSNTATLGMWAILMLLGLVIAPWPMVKRMLAGGFKECFNLPEYEVVTTYKDGTKTSDGGTESTIFNLVLKCILFAIIVMIGTVATFIYLIFLTIHYTILFVKANPKPSFLKSAYVFFIVLLLVIPGAVALGQFSMRHIERTAWERVINENQTVYNAIINADGQTITAYAIASVPGARITMTLLNPDGSRSGSKNLDAGTTVTITGRPIRTRAGGGTRHFIFQIPIMHQGDRGRINIRNLSMSPP